MCRVELCTELIYAIIPTLFLCFLLICYPYILLHFLRLLFLYNVGSPMEHLALDVLGPFPLTEDWNKYILIVADYFTKWVEAYPLPNQEAPTVAEVLVKEYVCCFGVPLLLHSDQGRNFESAVFQGMCQLLGIRKTRTTPYHPQSDGMVERFNRTLEAQLSKFAD